MSSVFYTFCPCSPSRRTRNRRAGPAGGSFMKKALKKYGPVRFSSAFALSLIIHIGIGVSIILYTMIHSFRMPAPAHLPLFTRWKPVEDLPDPAVTAAASQGPSGSGCYSGSRSRTFRIRLLQRQPVKDLPNPAVTAAASQGPSGSDCPRRPSHVLHPLRPTRRQLPVPAGNP